MVLAQIAGLLGLLAGVDSLNIDNGRGSLRHNEERGIAANITCPTDYTAYASVGHAPYSAGKYHLAYQRPPPECRTFVSETVEDTIQQMKKVIADPDLFRLFENSYPNTLDTTVKWKGKAQDSDEELTFIITGDIDAMWIRDSTSQLHSYLPFLSNASSRDSFASLFRGLINLQARFLLEAPYCNAFQPPLESGLPPVNNSGASAQTTVTPTPNNNKVFECKYELDSIAAFLQVSSEYFDATNDTAFFAKYKWIDALEAVLKIVEDQTYPTYSTNGSVVIAPYTFSAFTDRATETLSNNGYGNPVQGDTGLVRSTFRPSDDACIYELFIPANMMLATKLEATIPIIESIGDHDNLVHIMQNRVDLIQKGIRTKAVTAEGVFAYEIDGFGSVNSMDDASVPSLLSAPYNGYLSRSDPTYQASRRKILSTSNPYYMQGPVINSVGSPHIGPGWGWPMATIMQILTSDDDKEIKHCLETLVSSTNGLGLIHESIFTFDESVFTRPWFAWVNGLFGEMILDLSKRKPHILETSFQ